MRIPRGFRRIGRLLVGALPAGIALPVVSGPLRGARWIMESSNPSCWTGAFEPATQRFLVAHLRPGDRFVDVGAHVGFFTLLGSRLVGENGRVLAIEPLDRNARCLERHAALNRAMNVSFRQSAVSDFEGKASFGFADSPSCARLGLDGSEVDVHRLDSILESWEPEPIRLLKIDVEGAEAQVLEGARKTLTRRPCPSLWIATHGWRAHAATVELLREFELEGVEAQIDDDSGNGTVSYRMRD